MALCISKESQESREYSSSNKQVTRGQQKVKHFICCYYCIPWVPSFRLICIKPWLKIFSFLVVIQVIRGQQNGKHWIRCCNSIPGVPSFRLICIKPQLTHFLFVEVIRGHQRSFKFNFILFQEFRTLIRRAAKKLKDLNQK